MELITTRGDAVCDHQELIELRSELIVNSENTHGFQDIGSFLLTDIKCNFGKPSLLLGALIGKDGTRKSERNGCKQLIGEVGERAAEAGGGDEVVVVIGRNQVTHICYPFHMCITRTV